MLERTLENAYPERFDTGERVVLHKEFAGSYVHSLLEACVARCGSARNFERIEPVVERSVEEMVSILDASSYEVVACRLVAHLTTESRTPVQIGDVTVLPEDDPDLAANETLLQRLVQEIPGAPGAFNREPPRLYDPPLALLITRMGSDDPDAFSVYDRLTNQLERFLLLARLLTAGTVQSYYEVRGGPMLVSPIPADYLTFGRSTIFGLGGIRIRRTVRLRGDEKPTFDALGELIDSAEVKREGMAATSLDAALGRFNASHIPGNPFEHLVDLSTALEAILAGGETDNEALTFRLKSRAAVLLATDEDPARTIFDDVGRLYGLRSKVVHGGQMKQTDLRKIVGKVSTVPPDEAEERFGIASDRVVDRMKDLVRRALLARLCLAAQPDPLWPFEGPTPVDALLSDDATRVAWRTRWHERMGELGAADAAGPPRAAVDFLSKEDR